MNASIDIGQTVLRTPRLILRVCSRGRLRVGGILMDFRHSKRPPL